MLRKDYEHIEKTFFSIKNEPIGYSYPDMYSAYKNFSKNFNIPIGNFILTNGCENAIRILLSLFSKEITTEKPLLIEKPGWELVSVLAYAMDIPYKFYYYDNEFKTNYDKTHIVYTTDTYNNVIKHEFPSGEADIYIIDESYTMKHYFNEIQIQDNHIIIGSFSKLVDPGIRLGYILFSDKYRDKMNLLREQYVNKNAVDILKNLFIKKPDFTKPKIENSELIVASHSTYLTLKINDFPLSHKKFSINNINYCRIGRLSDKSQEVLLLNDILRNIKE